MPQAGWVKLRKIAQAYCRKRLHEAEDLLQEAFTRALADARHCPHDVDIVYFLAEAMRSIASDKAKSRRRKPELKFGELAPFVKDDEELEFDPPDKGPTAEEQLMLASEILRQNKPMLLEIPQRRLPIIAPPIYTNCQASGNQVNCTSH